MARLLGIRWRRPLVIETIVAVTEYGTYSASLVADAVPLQATAGLAIAWLGHVPLEFS